MNAHSPITADKPKRVRGRTAAESERAPDPVAAVAEATANATIPSRPVIQHTKLLRAELQVRLSSANGALTTADTALVVAAQDRDAAIELANQRYAAIRAEIDAERDDVLTTIAGLEAALHATKPAEFQPSAQQESGE
jgi:hypothetical protein